MKKAMTMGTQPQRLSYDHDKFVDRTDEVKLVLDKAQQLVKGPVQDKRVVIFHGARGSGKSWLLQEIAYQLKANSASPCCVYIDLPSALEDNPPSDDDTFLSKIIAQIYGSLTQATEAVMSDDLTPAEWARLLSETLARPERALVVLFDHVDESASSLLELLEDRCLSPLAVAVNVLIVLAGRGKEYIWKGPELRLKSEERDLLYFDLAWTREQLQRQVPQPAPTAEEIQPLSAGYPWSNYILSTNFANQLDALNQCVVFLLANLNLYPEALEHLEALCTLRVFSDEMITAMLAAYFDDLSYREWPYPQYRSVRQNLIRTTLVKWDGDQGGYIIDAALRHVLEHQLYLRDRVTWERLHIAACDLFRIWMADYPRTVERWREEITYHENKLAHGPQWVPQS
jgi:hypothetical protein